MEKETRMSGMVMKAPKDSTGGDQKKIAARRALLGLLFVIAGFSCAGCASYHLGNQYLYRSDIRTVHVMIFESDSARRYLGQRLTEAVIKDIELNTPLVITDPQIADSFVRGRIIAETKRAVAENLYDEPRTLRVAWRVEVDWVGVPLMQLQSVVISRDAEFIPEGGQSMATAQQRVIEQAARDLISQMQTPW
ncbi:LPS assembly lipoprotein LptE [Mariniblastus sp.]|nr:LPS assembly lipoprotein LptE [Mariniblastus sp.]